MVKQRKEQRKSHVGRRREDIREEQIRMDTKQQIFERELMHGKSTLNGIREVTDLLVKQVQRVTEQVGNSEATQLANHNAFEQRMLEKQSSLLKWIVRTLVASIGSIVAGAGAIGVVVLEWYLSK